MEIISGIFSCRAAASIICEVCPCPSHIADKSAIPNGGFSELIILHTLSAAIFLGGLIKTKFIDLVNK
ncbi:hypothetical protein SMITH_258 [Smithella sp. ME-1]|nr:hypothetical protein SMITH_258 [Smithella sp. ME-1]